MRSGADVSPAKMANALKGQLAGFYRQIGEFLESVVVASVGEQDGHSCLRAEARLVA